jgi:hypothetical protein
MIGIDCVAAGDAIGREGLLDVVAEAHRSVSRLNAGERHMQMKARRSLCMAVETRSASWQLWP